MKIDYYSALRTEELNAVVLNNKFMALITCTPCVYISSTLAHVILLNCSLTNMWYYNRLPAGVVIIGLQKLGGETMHDKRQRERGELHELRVTEWLVTPGKENIFLDRIDKLVTLSWKLSWCLHYRNARLKLTDDLIGEMKCEKHQDTDNDLQRIEELLNQPRNEKGAKSSDSQ